MFNFIFYKEYILQNSETFYVIIYRFSIHFCYLLTTTISHSFGHRKHSGLHHFLLSAIAYISDVEIYDVTDGGPSDWEFLFPNFMQMLVHITNSLFILFRKIIIFTETVNILVSSLKGIYGCKRSLNLL